MPPLRWAVLLVDLDPVEGHEQSGKRRVLVVSLEAFHRSGLVLACPITAARPEAQRLGEVAIPVGEAGQTKPGVILCFQARTMSLLRVERSQRPHYLTDPKIRGQVRAALAMFAGLDAPGLEDGADVDDYFGLFS